MTKHTTQMTLTDDASRIVKRAAGDLVVISRKAVYDEIAAYLIAASKAYYESGDVLIDDATYDRLMRAMAEAADTHTDWMSDVVTQVAAGAQLEGDVAHAIPMLSLDNVFDEADLTAWTARLVELAGQPLDEIDICVEPKFDGVALSAKYVDGVLTQLVTRGDGTHGEDVSHAIVKANLNGLPDQIVIEDYREVVGEGELEVRGELIMSDTDFAAANAARISNGKNAFANPRNATAGSLRSASRTYKLDMTFIGYDALVLNAQGVRQDPWNGHTAAMKAVGSLGIRTTATLVLPDKRAALELVKDAYTAVERIGSLRAAMGFGTDGAVIKADSKVVQATVGSGSRAPRWAIAYKYPADMRLTVLEDIEIQVGRTGRLTPVAQLRAVEVGGVTITSATLNNPDDIARKDVRVGDWVWVRRAGEVIPEVVGPDLTRRPEGTHPWVGPDHCPQCGGDVDQSEAIWRCHNRNCGTREAIEYFASRKAMDIDGLGPKAVDLLIESGAIQDVSDLYALRIEDVVKLERFGRTSAENLIASIDDSRSRGLERVLTGLGLRFLGRRLSSRIAKVYSNIDEVLDDVETRGTEALASIEGFGDVKAVSIAAELAASRSLIGRLDELGVDMTSKSQPVVAAAEEGPLFGKRVLITGSVAGYTRDSVKTHAESLGATVASSVSKTLDMVIAGEKPGGSKITKANSLGIPIRSPQEAGLVT